MRPELAYLALSAVLYMVMIAVQGLFTNLENDPKTLLGARDELNDKSLRLKRAKRAIVNMNEAMHMFTPLAVAVVVAGAASDLSAIGAAVFFWSRVLYFPLYVVGAPTLRSIVWVAGVVGVVMTGWPLLP